MIVVIMQELHDQSPGAVTFRKGVTPGLPFRRPALTEAAVVHRVHRAAD